MSPQWQAKVAGVPISQATLLATDYLNHFNEVIMLVGMVASMPEVLDDLKAWHSKTYAEHFRGGSLTYGALAAEAYDHVPDTYKGPFERTIRQLEQVVQLTIKRVNAEVQTGDRGSLEQTASTAVAAMTALVASADSIIAGGRETLAQAEIDRLIGK